MSWPETTPRRGAALVTRLALYALSVGLVLEWVVVALPRGNIDAWIREDGIVETMQLCLAFAAATLFALAAVRRQPFHAWLAIAGLACAFAGARELDGLFGLLVGPNGYKLLAVPVATAAAIVAFVGRRRLVGEIGEFVGAPASWLMFFGAFLVLVHAQILGQKELWTALLPLEGGRLAKRSFEEFSELTGYCLLLCAAVEALIAESKVRASESRGSTGERRGR